VSEQQSEGLLVSVMKIYSWEFFSLAMLSAAFMGSNYKALATLESNRLEGKLPAQRFSHTSRK